MLNITTNKQWQKLIHSEAPRKTHESLGAPLQRPHASGNLDDVPLGRQSRRSNGSILGSLFSDGPGRQGRPRARRQGVLLDGAAIKFKLEWRDHIRIYGYHAFEPLTLAASLAVCLQAPCLPTMIYILLILLTMLPLTLTAHIRRIQVKICLSVLMLLLAVALTTLKGYILYAVGDRRTTPGEGWAMAQLGISQQKPVATLFVDVSMIVSSILLITHLLGQKKQSKER